jgi:hypothetical protein
MHSSSENKNTNDYNHVLDKLQDYMLNGKTLARTFYQKFSDEETKSSLKCEIQKPGKSWNGNGNIKEKAKLKEPERFFYPNEKDQLFWCFYIIQNGFEKYEHPGITTFVNEKAEKFKCIEHMRMNKQQLKVKKIKNIKEDVEDELANKQTIGMKTFIALCIANNINIMYIHKRKCFELVFDEQMPTYVVHCINNNDSSAYKYCHEQNVTKEQLDKYRTDYFNWESVDKPLKAMSSYKLDELVELCKRMELPELSNKNKKNLYEQLLMNI